jgi:hypothetical protein
MVWECAHEVVYAADDRQAPWPGRWVIAFFVFAWPELEDDKREQ